MLGTRARPELDALEARLRGWEGSVPPRARRFHEVGRELRTQIRGALPFWRPWINDEILERFQERVRRLGEVAEELAPLVAGAERLEAEVRSLEQRFADGGDADLDAWLRQRCRDWLIDLARLGTDCDRAADLHRDRRLLADIEAAVRLHDEAIGQVREAGRVLAVLGANVQAASLAATLPDLRRRLLDGGAIHEWIAEIKRLIQPLRAVADRVEDPPKELRNIGVLLTELHGWSHQLGELASEVEKIEQRHNLYTVDWSDANVQELRAAAEGLRERLLDRARQVRGERLQLLEEQIEDLFQARGHHQELAQQLTQLKARPSDRYQLFRDWLDQFDRVNNRFKALAQTHEGALEERLATLLERLQESLDRLLERPLSDAVRHEAEGLRYDLGRLARVPGIEEILRSLRHGGDIERGIDRLERRAEQEFEEVEKRQSDLTSRNQLLQEEARRLRIKVPDLAPRIAELSQGTAERSLERSRQSASELAAEMEELERQFALRCQERLDRRLADTRRVADVLRQVGRPLPLPPDAAIAAGAAPSAASRAVAEGRRLYLHAMHAARAALLAIQEECEQARRQLAAMDLEALPPGEREDAERLHDELRDGSWLHERDFLERLRLAAELAQKCGLFFDRLLAEQRDARDRLEELKRRLRRFNEEHLHRFCPDLADRVAALVLGVPGRPRQWSALRSQLDLAEELFDRVEAQARRLAAGELDRAAGELKLRLRGAMEPAFRGRVETLLAELGACGQEELPPVTLRLQVLNAVHQAGARRSGR